MNNKLDLKNWVKKLVLESINFDETYNDYQIEVDNIAISGLADEGTMVTISMDINYNTNGGHSEQGQFSGPDRAVQGEGTSIEIVNAIPTTIVVNGKESVVKTLQPEQITAVKEYVANYLTESEQEIIDVIQKSQGLEESTVEPSDINKLIKKLKLIKNSIDKSKNSKK